MITLIVFRRFLPALQPSSVGHTGHLPAPFGWEVLGAVGQVSANAACNGVVPQDEIQVTSLKGIIRLNR